MTQAEENPDPRRELVIYDDVRIDLIPYLYATIEQMATQDAGRPRAGSLNVGGWKSDTKFLDGAGAPRELRDTILSHLQSYLGTVDPGRVSSWAMVNRRGSLHQRHQHQGARISVIYYVHPGEDPETPTVFELPRGGEALVYPVPGRLTLFPGRMFHRVPRYPGEAPRTTIALDVK